MKTRNKIIIGIIILIIILLLMKGCNMLESEQTITKSIIDESRISSSGMGGDREELISLLLEEGFIVGVDEVCEADCDEIYDSCEEECIDDDFEEGMYEVPGEDVEYCLDHCDTEWDYCFRDCLIYADDEVYEWDGDMTDDIGSFYRDNYPIFYENARGICEMTGTWIERSDTIGCTDMMWFMGFVCDTATIQSAGEVCETVGGTYECNPVTGTALCSLR